MGFSETQIVEADVPSKTTNLVACKVCGLIKTEKQFQDKGCENCPFLSLRGDQIQCEDCTTQGFSGLVMINEPHKSWVAKWLHLNNMAAGLYSLSIDQDIPYEIKDMLDNQNIPYRIRNEDFYPENTT